MRSKITLRLKLVGPAVALGLMLFSAGAAIGAGCATNGCTDICTLIETLVLADGQYNSYDPSVARRGCNTGQGTQTNPSNPQPGTVTTYNNGMTTSNCPNDTYPIAGSGTNGTVVFVDNNGNYNQTCPIGNGS